MARLAVVVTMCAFAAASCEQNVSRLRPGGHRSRNQGTDGYTQPSRDTVQAPRRRSGRKLTPCSNEDVARVVEVWAYERWLRRDILIALDSQRRLVCLGRGGVTFTQ